MFLHPRVDGMFRFRTTRSLQRQKRSSRRLRRPTVERLDQRALLAADFALDISDSGESIQPGGSAVYSFDFANVGDREGVATLHATLPRPTTVDVGGSDPDWVCRDGRFGTTECKLELGEVAADSAGSAALALNLKEKTPSVVKNISVTGTIAGDRYRRDRNDSDRESTPVTHLQHDLTLDLNDNDVEISPGGTVVYSVDYANDGTAVAEGTEISVRLPARTSFDAAGSHPDWSCERQRCTLDVGDVQIESGGSAPLAAIVDADYAGARIVALAAIDADGFDANPRNNLHSETTRVVQQLPDLTIELSDGGAEVQPGGTISYTIDYANRGSVAATEVVVGVRIPYQTTAQTDGTAWNCDRGWCQLAVPDLDAQGTGSASLEVLVDAELRTPRLRRFGGPQLYAMARVTLSGADANGRDNRAYEGTPVSRQFPDLSIRVSDADATAQPGGLLQYTVDYANNGLSDATDVVVTVRIPRHATAPDAEGDWLCKNGLCTLKLGDLAAGDRGSITLDLTVNTQLPVRQTALFGFADIRQGHWNPDADSTDNRTFVRTLIG